MTTEIWINDTVIHAYQFTEETVAAGTADTLLKKIIFDFKVTSKDYHDIAVLLYEMEFQIRIPEKQWDFRAAISNYSTSITNLYNDNEVADYHLELVEKV